MFLTLQATLSQKARDQETKLMMMPGLLILTGSFHKVVGLLRSESSANN